MHLLCHHWIFHCHRLKDISGSLLWIIQRSGSLPCQKENLTPHEKEKRQWRSNRKLKHSVNNWAKWSKPSATPSCASCKTIERSEPEDSDQCQWQGDLNEQQNGQKLRPSPQNSEDLEKRSHRRGRKHKLAVHGRPLKIWTQKTLYHLYHHRVSPRFYLISGSGYQWDH